MSAVLRDNSMNLQSLVVDAQDSGERDSGARDVEVTWQRPDSRYDFN